jgi:hypothetical protein
MTRHPVDTGMPSSPGRACFAFGLPADLLNQIPRRFLIPLN